MVFKAKWPTRFGPDAILAIKMLKDGFESDMHTLESFVYEARVLEAARCAVGAQAHVLGSLVAYKRRGCDDPSHAADVLVT